MFRRRRLLKKIRGRFPDVSMEEVMHAEEHFRHDIARYVFGLLRVFIERHGEYSPQVRAGCISLLGTNELLRIAENSRNGRERFFGIEEVIRRDERWRYKPEFFLGWYNKAYDVKREYSIETDKLDNIAYGIRSSYIYVALKE